MPTNKKRISIVIDDSLEKTIQELAIRNDRSISNMSRQLIFEALTAREAGGDISWQKMEARITELSDPLLVQLAVRILTEILERGGTLASILEETES